MVTPTQNWPKPYLLKIHEEAVKQGFIWIQPISEADARSLRDRLYRIRRRSDTSMAAFIPAEYHLVMVGVWEPGAEGVGRLPIIYNRKADGSELPAIVGATGDEVNAYTAPPVLTVPPPPVIEVSSMDLSIKPDEIDSFVAKMRKNARDR
jgi:hypothetical protein